MRGLKEYWKPEEDLLFVEKYIEFDGDCKQIQENFFQNRSVKSLQSRYYKLTRLADQNHIDIKSYVEKNVLLPRLPEIENILINENNNSRILNKIKKFGQKEVTDVMLNICQKNNLLISRLVFIFKYIIDNCENKSLIIDSFFSSINEIRVDLFLQQCIIFRIFTYSELAEKINYVKDIQYLDFCPILNNYKDRNDILSNARLIKKNKNIKKEIFKTQNQLENLIEISEKKIVEQDETIENMISESSELKTNYSIVLSQNAHHQDAQYELTKILKENYLVKKEKLNKYPILELMLNYLNDKKTDENYYKFCSLLKIMNNYSFQYLHRLIPIYSSTTCYNFSVYLQKNLITMMQNKEFISLILEVFYYGVIEFKDHRPVRPIIINLGGDAASLKYAFESTKNAVYVFEVLPIDSELRPCVVHMMPTKNGSSPKEVVTRFFEIANYLTEIGFIVKYFSTDGDISFDSFHSDFFKKYIQNYLDQPLDEIILNIENNIFLPLSDLLHLIKSARAKLVNHLLMIDIDNLICINTQLFIESTGLGPVLEDKSRAAAMKDQYALSLFSWNTLILAIENGRFDAAFFILPFVYLIEAVRSPLLSQKMRLKFISFAFSLFKFHYQEIQKVPANSMFQQRYHETCLGVLFADNIFLYRIMNTCIGLAIAIKQNPSNLPLQRLGSHDLELFFAYIRLLSFDDNSYMNAIRVAVRAIIIRKYATDIGYPIIIKKRENAAGIILSDEINNQEDFDFDGEKLNKGLYMMLRGESMDQQSLIELTNIINNYTKKILSSKYKIAKVPHLMSGWHPYCRFTIMNYAFSVLPIPHPKSAFEYYLKSNETQKKIQKQSIFEWFIKIINKVFENDKISELKIPFKYDITKEEDRNKITEYYSHLKLTDKEDEQVDKTTEKEKYKKIKLKKMNDDSEFQSYIDMKNVLNEEYLKNQSENIETKEDQILNNSTQNPVTQKNEIENFLSSETMEEAYQHSREIFSLFEQNGEQSENEESQNENEENQSENEENQNENEEHQKENKKHQSHLKKPLKMQINWQLDLFKSIELFLFSMRPSKNVEHQNLFKDNLLPLINNDDQNAEISTESQTNDIEEIDSIINDYSFETEDPNLEDE